MKKRIFSTILAAIMVLVSVPFSVNAKESEYVYISVSYDGEFVSDCKGESVAYIPVPIDKVAAIDLAEYGLGDFCYDGNGDSKYDITALHLFIYAHEKIFGLDWEDVKVTGSPGSIFFEEGLFGFEDCNLNYYLNGIYPEITPGWGATADILSLVADDFYDIAGYTSWDFWTDSASGFNYFADEKGNIVHEYTTESGEETQIKLIRKGGGFGNELTSANVENSKVYYGRSFGNAVGNVITNTYGSAILPKLSDGTWYLWCDGGYGAEYTDAKVSAPAYATLNAGSNTALVRQSQNVSGVLNSTLSQLANTVKEPTFGTNAGEWSVLCLARSEYFDKDDKYFTDYYARIVEYVNTKAQSVNLNGALHKSKSTDNSRVIIALSSIGKDAENVGNWDLIAPYNDFNWIKNQGINGIIYTLIALDTNNYQTSNTTIRRQCLDYLLDKQLEDGGWALSGKTFNADITGMALQALYPYRNDHDVSEAAEKAFKCLSENQLETGGFKYGTGETSESAVQVAVACTAWGINPDTDPRFIKNGNSVIDNILSYYVEEDAMFKHVYAGDSNAMATDQACYALIAYDRFINNKTFLYDMSDVGDDNDNIVIGEPKAILGIPAEISGDTVTFKATVGIDQWDNSAGYKLIDFIINVPDGLSVIDVKAGSRLGGGEVSYNLDEDNDKLRVVYFDANNYSNITVSGTIYPVQLFTVEFNIDKAIAGDKLKLSLNGMSIKLTSDPADKNSMVIVDTSDSKGSIDVVKGISYSAVCLYTGDDIDLIPSSKKAVAVSVAGIEDTYKLTYNDGINMYEFKYSAEITEKSGIHSYIALVDSNIDTAQFANKENYTITREAVEEIIFGDSNGDGVVNAQDALASVDAWLRKTDAPDDNRILAMNVNSDSRINTFDALGVVEAFVNNNEYIIVNKAAIVVTNS